MPETIVQNVEIRDEFDRVWVAAGTECLIALGYRPVIPAISTQRDRPPRLRRLARRFRRAAH